MDMRSGGAAMVLIVTMLCAPSDAETLDQAALEALKPHYRRESAIPYPQNNPPRAEKIALGRRLFFDKNLSGSGALSCASCHDPRRAWSGGADGLARTGNPHRTRRFTQRLPRKIPTLLNLAWDEASLWDGSAASLEAQALLPFANRDEMGLSMAMLLGRLRDDESYPSLFAEAFADDPAPVSVGNVAKLLAAFERTIVSGESPFDRWVNGDDDAMDESAKRGLLLFHGKANCAVCHAGWRMSDGGFHDIGLNSKDIGRGAHVPDPALLFAFKTPTLRDIAKRAPYMHNGSLKDLRAVINHYDVGFVKRKTLSPEMRRLGLTPQEVEDLRALLLSLSEDEAR